MKRGRVDALEEVRGGNPSLTVATADDHGRFQRQHAGWQDRKSTRLNSSHPSISYAVFCLKKKMTVVRSGSLFDGVSATLLTDPILVIDGPTIVPVDRRVEPPPGADIVDIAGATLLPSLCD